MIEKYEPGEIIVDGKTYTQDVIIFPDKKILKEWWRKESHQLALNDLKQLPTLFFDVLLIGRGYDAQLVVSQEVRDFFISKNIEVIEEPTTLAWKTYNHLVKEKKVTAAFHLTC